MRIGLLIDTLNSGGAQRQLVVLAKELKMLGHEVIVCIYMPGRFYAHELQKAQIELIELHPKNRWQKFSMVYAWLQKWQPQVVQTFLEGANAIAELTSVLPHSWKIVVSERYTGPPPNRVKRLRWQLHRRADWITTNSYANMEQILRVVPTLKAKSSVIWNMVDLEHFSPSTITSNRTSDGIVRFLCVASMAPRKNALCLVEALHLLHRRNIHNFHVRWVGSLQPNACHTTMYEKLCRLVKQYQLEHHFTFTGEKANVVQEYYAADALVLVSLFEGLPNVVCEAMASGLPVVLSDVSDHRKMVEEGRTGFFCSPHEAGSIADALQSIIRLPEGPRRAMGELARKAAENQFNRERFIEEHERVYRRICQGCSFEAEIRVS
jgi:glycosyltransferase involved in cell wall biosynthesis